MTDLSQKNSFYELFYMGNPLLEYYSFLEYYFMSTWCRIHFYCWNETVKNELNLWLELENEYIFNMGS